MTKGIQRRVPQFAKMTLLEASLSRIYDHYKNRIFGILSANRADKTQEENEANYYNLKEDIRDKGYSYVALRGMGYEVDPETQKQVLVEEPSFLVVNNDTPYDAFRDDIIVLGKKYDQDAIIVHSPAKETGNSVTELLELKPSVHVVMTFDNIRYNQLADVYSGLRGGRPGTFSFEKVLADKGCSNSLHQLGRSKSGELLELTGAEEDQLLGILKYLRG